MHIRKSFLASAVLLGIGMTGQAWAQAQNTENGPGRNLQIAIEDNSDNSNSSSGDNRDNDGYADSAGYGTAAANNGGTATSTFSSSFNTSQAIATTQLDGYVTDIRTRDIGNYATNNGNANGGSGGAGGAGVGGAGGSGGGY
ncbi:MAG TPA: hypothetical protein VJ806_05815, partial [Luteimonas sp.]|nr:hypothetical protein [Luteimonas sp.]